MPREVALEWLLARGDDFSVIDEIYGVLSNVPQFEREMRTEELYAVLERARMGRLTEGDLLQPVRLDPVVWELRFSFTAGVYRLYFGEPQSNAEVLVGLRFHLKDLEGTEEDIRAAQESEMELASERLSTGENDRWGWPQ